MIRTFKKGRCLLFFFGFSLSLSAHAQDEQTVNIDGSRVGRVFEGIGALSAGASSRLLLDYPQKYRKEVLDLLFKPNYGASLHQLKVEIGGNINSTDGTEPSHAHTRKEFLHPKPDYFKRGYEWMLLREAKKRNPDIIFDCLEWGLPGWVGNGNFFSHDNVNYVISFLKGAKKYHKINFDYTGIWNERRFELEWIKQLRNGLDSSGFGSVKIIAADGFNWKIADSLAKYPDVNEAVYALGIHYNERWKKGAYSSTEVARSLNKSLRLSEGGPWSGDWKAFSYFAKMNNRSYIEGKITNIVTWSLVTSYYDNLSLPGSGLMKANAPWNGHYEVQPALWAVAHTTQFVKPGWTYLDSGCGYLKSGSYVSLLSPDRKDLSMIFETVDTTAQQTVRFKLSAGLPNETLSVWKSTKNKEEFVRLSDIQIINGEFTVDLEGESIYSLTTTRGQTKGSSLLPVPPKVAFPFPYSDSFDKSERGLLPLYFIDQGGVFEVHKRSDEKGNCLKQVMPEPGIEWGKKSQGPASVLGDTSARDYSVSVDANLNKGRYASVMGRVTETYRGEKLFKGYTFRVTDGQVWELFAGEKQLAFGKLTTQLTSWFNLKLSMRGPTISAMINGREVVSLNDSTYPKGLAGLGCDFNPVEFDNFKISQ